MPRGERGQLLTPDDMGACKPQKRSTLYAIWHVSGVDRQDVGRVERIGRIPGSVLVWEQSEDGEA